MGTNFYWKEIPQEIKDLVTEENRYTRIYEEKRGDVDTFNESDSIFKHIGKRSASGYYCYRCGTTLCKKGTDEVHKGGPDIGLILCGDGVSAEERARRKAKYDEQARQYYFDKCPCCGATKEDTDIVKGSCSFRWTMMLHKKIILEHMDDEQYIIVNEYDEEFTCRQFMENEYLPTVVIENQMAWEFA